eukprot:266118_1
MKAFILNALFCIAYVYGHQFWAEHNLICNICDKSVQSIINGKEQQDILKLCDDKTNSQFTTICSQVFDNTANILQMHNNEHKTSTQICKSLSMCTEWIDTEFESKHVWNEQLVNTINKNNTISWNAQLPDTLKGFTLAQIRRKLGSVIDPNYVYKLPDKTWDPSINLPTQFDSRTTWPYCANTIGHIRDQSECGSCWAFASTEAMNDRLCISNVTKTVFSQLLSVEDTTSCCTDVPCGYSAGCSGGMPTAVWSWFESNGVCSGGDYPDIGKNDTCQPYSLPPCAHAGQPEKDYTPCPTTQYNTPKCLTNCGNKAYPIKEVSNDKHFGSKAYQLRGVNSMMQDIVEYGSVSATMLVHEDFLSYKSGVYYWQNGQPLGGHAVKIFGYGIENGKHYWWCTNSWNDEWGMNGFFKILKGTDESGIEDQVAGGIAKS